MVNKYFLSLGRQTPDSTSEYSETFDLPTYADLLKLLTLEAEKFGQSAWVLAFEDYKVSIGYLSKGELYFGDEHKLDPNYIQELRLFNQKGEFYLWRQGNSFRSRGRFDYRDMVTFAYHDELCGYSPPADKNLPDVAEEWQLLWGTQVTKKGSWSEVSEARGVRFTFPSVLTENQLPLRLRVRHYINYDPMTGLAYYNDLRLVDLRDVNCQPLQWL